MKIKTQSITHNMYPCDFRSLSAKPVVVAKQPVLYYLHADY